MQLNMIELHIRRLMEGKNRFDFDLMVGLMGFLIVYK
jgi:hypothetical protein